MQTTKPPNPRNRHSGFRHERLTIATFIGRMEESRNKQLASIKFTGMKKLISLEELALTATAIYFLSQHNLGLSVWIWILLFFSPDISMLGYLFGPRVGAVSYNFFHHRGIALCLAFAGYFFSNEIILAIGILLFAHSSFDRILGYGLKYFSGFSDTHLGTIGKKVK